MGCYLAQDLPYIRHAANVFARALAIIHEWNEGKFTEEEDKHILSLVAKTGANQKIWGRLAKDLTRRKPANIKKRYVWLTDGKQSNFGKWSDVEYQQFLNYIFKDANSGNENAVEYIESIPLSVIYEAAKVVNRLPDSVYEKWTGHLQPIFLSYHNGSLFTDVKTQFLKYLIVKKVNSIQDIDWKDAKERFIGHNTASLRRFLSLEKFKQFPMYKSIEDYLPTLKHSSRKRPFFETRKRLIFLYDKARGANDVTGDTGLCVIAQIESLLLSTKYVIVFAKVSKSLL